MKHAFQPLVLILLLGAAGCASSGGPGLGYQNINAFTARYLDVQQKRMEFERVQPLTIFSYRDLIAAVVRNYTYQDQLVLVEFLRADNREPVFKKPLQVAAGGWAATTPTKPLPAGEYLLKVTPNGMQPFMQPFSVRGL
jgi:hypothetical protein